MDSVTLIIGAVVIALCTLPFVFMGRKKRKHENELKQAFSGLVMKENCTPGESEILGDYIIGADQLFRFFFFYKKAETGENACRVKLSEIRSCKMSSVGHTVGDKGNSILVTDKLNLVFNPIDKNQPSVVLELFNSDESMQLNGEIQLAEKWEKLINHHLKP